MRHGALVFFNANRLDAPDVSSLYAGQNVLIDVWVLEVGMGEYHCSDIFCVRGKLSIPKEQSWQ